MCNSAIRGGKLKMKILKRLTFIPVLLTVVIWIPLFFLVWCFTGKYSPLVIAEKYTEWIEKIDTTK